MISEGKDPDQAWFWTKEWQQAEDGAEDDIKNGRLKSFNNLEDAFAELDKDDDEIEKKLEKQISIPPLYDLLKKATPNRYDKFK